MLHDTSCCTTRRVAPSGAAACADRRADAIFDISNLHHTYRTAGPVAALRGIELRIEQGEYVAIVGANGSGKSTLARHLNGLLLPSEGQVRVLGLDTRDPQHTRAIRQAVQMVFQQPDAQIVATVVEEDVAFGPENFGVPWEALNERVREALETVGMWAERARPPHLLSGGQKQRVAIAGALAVHPAALILDEATAMLDPAGRTAVLQVLGALHAGGTTIITITHEMDEAAEAERVIVLERGRVALDGPPREVFAEVERIRGLGLDVPPVADVALRLGLPVSLTAGELVAGVRQKFGAPVTIAPVAETAALPDPGPTEGPEAAAAPILKVEDLHHTYLLGTPFASPALQGVSLSVGTGDAIALIGQTGSGKSTLMQHLNGLLRLQSGRVWVDGHDLGHPDVDVRAVRQAVGLLFQHPEDQLFERFVGDDVAFGPRQMGFDRAEVRERVREAMESVGLPFEAFKDREVRTLSGGEQRRAALAGVLALRPKVLVVDEPTAGLDPRGRDAVISIFRGLNERGVTLVLSSHRVADIAAACRTAIALRGGVVAAQGTVREVLTEPGNIARHGMPVPALVLVAERLRAEGWPVPSGALLPQEIAGAIRSAHRTGAGTEEARGG